MIRKQKRPSLSDLRHQVDIQALTKVDDGAGGYSESWVTSQTLWAAIEPVSSIEKYLAQQQQHHLTHIVKVRKTTGITTKHRVVFQNRIFHIHGVWDLDNRNFFLVLNCEERSV